MFRKYVLPVCRRGVCFCPVDALQGARADSAFKAGRRNPLSRPMKTKFPVPNREASTRNIAVGTPMSAWL